MPIYKPGRPKRYSPASSREAPPQSPGEYRMRRADGTVYYIGETNNLARRLREHIRSGKLPTDGSATADLLLADRRSSSATRRQHEQTSIQKYQPSLNKSRGGEGRPATRRKRTGSTV